MGRKIEPKDLLEVIQLVESINEYWFEKSKETPIKAIEIYQEEYFLLDMVNEGDMLKMRDSCERYDLETYKRSVMVCPRSNGVHSLLSRDQCREWSAAKRRCEAGGSRTIKMTLRPFTAGDPRNRIDNRAGSLAIFEAITTIWDGKGYRKIEISAIEESPEHAEDLLVELKSEEDKTYLVEEVKTILVLGREFPIQEGPGSFMLNSLPRTSMVLTSRTK